MDPTTQKRTCLITGASAGIGYELAKIFARNGFDLILVSRDSAALGAVADELHKEFGISATPLAANLAFPYSPREIASEVKRRSIRIDVLVNNAGFGVFGPFAETNLQEELDMIQVHIAALTELTKHFLKEMVSRHDGKILQVASTAAFQPGPRMAIYYATKAYILSFAEAVSNELRGSGVTMSVLCPGPTTTGFQKKAGMGDSIVATTGKMSAQRVAEAGYAGLMRGKAVIIPGILNKSLTVGVRLLPRAIVRSVVRFIQERR
jgi:short-subunit dehydrogenase